MSEDHFNLRRRDLLALAPACAVSVGLTSSPAAAACLFGHHPEHLALAYWPGSETLPSLERVSELSALEPPEEDDEAELGELIPAERLARGEARFARSGARLRVHGLFGSNGPAAERLTSLAIEAHFTPFHDTQAHFWRFNSGAPSCACPPSAMTLPVTAETGVRLSFQVEGQADSQPATRFTLGGESGVPKLRRGIYLATWRGEGARSLPSWRRFRLEARALPEHDAEGAATGIRLAQGLDPSLTADQAYLVLSFDHAS